MYLLVWDDKSMNVIISYDYCVYIFSMCRNGFWWTISDLLKSSSCGWLAGFIYSLTNYVSVTSAEDAMTEIGVYNFFQQQERRCPYVPCSGRPSLQVNEHFLLQRKLQKSLMQLSFFARCSKCLIPSYFQHASEVLSSFTVTCVKAWQLCPWDQELNEPRVWVIRSQEMMSIVLVTVWSVCNEGL